MAIFELRAPDGSLQSIEAEDEQAARAKLAEMQASQPGLPAAADLSAQAREAAFARMRRSMRHDPGRSGVEMIEAVSPTAADAVRSAGTGLAQGAIGVVGLPGDVRGMASMAADFVGNKLGAGPESVDAFKSAVRRVAPGVPGLSAFAYAPGAAEIKKDVESYTGEFHQPKTTAGEYARTFGEFAPAALGGPAGLARRILMGGVAPAIGSETAGQYYKGTEKEQTARFIGALTGGVLGMRGWTPAPATPEHAARTAIVEGAGTRLTAGARSGSELVQALEGIGGSIPYRKYAAPLNERSRQDVANSMERLQRESGDIRDWQAMENARTKAGAQGAEELLTPAQVKAAIVAQRRGPSAPGQDKLAEFVDAADAVVKPIPTKAGPNEAALVAAMAYPTHWLAEQMIGPKAANIAAAAVPAIAGRAAVSGPGQWWLGNQDLPVSRQDLIRALLVQGVVARPKEFGE